MQYLMAKYPTPQSFTPTNPSKYVGNLATLTLRSSWERKLAIYCDTHPKVKRWGCETLVIPYISSIDGSRHRYFVDFILEVEDVHGKLKKVAIEVKPKCQTQAPILPKRKTQKAEARYLRETHEWIRNQDKWKAARAFCGERDITFVIMTEAELDI